MKNSQYRYTRNRRRVTVYHFISGSEVIDTFYFFRPLCLTAWLLHTANMSQIMDFGKVMITWLRDQNGNDKTKCTVCESYLSQVYIDHQIVFCSENCYAKSILDHMRDKYKGNEIYYYNYYYYTHYYFYCKDSSRCLKPGCDKIRFVDHTKKKCEDYCGRTHATEHKQELQTQWLSYLNEKCGHHQQRYLYSTTTTLRPHQPSSCQAHQATYYEYGMFCSFHYLYQIC